LCYFYTVLLKNSSKISQFKQHRKFQTGQLKGWVLLLVAFGFTHLAFSQVNKTDTLTFSSLKKTKLQYILDDTYIFGGFTSSSIYYSNYFRHQGKGNGMVLGIEQYFPLTGKVFISTGFNVTQRNTTYLKNSANISVNNFYLDVPVTSAFELPIFRNFDLRLLIGANTGLRLNSAIKGNYENIENQSKIMVYNKNDFHRLDFGWAVGVSAEYRNVLFRFRCHSGFIKLDKKDQGMLNSLQMEVGYFLFRGINNRK
jgi:hypothetical protein